MNRTDLQLFIRPGHKQQRETAMWPGHYIVRPPHHYKSSNKTKIQPRERSLQMVPTPVPVPQQQRCPSTFNLSLRPVVSFLFTPKVLFMISEGYLNVLSGARGLNNLGVLCISLIMGTDMGSQPAAVTNSVCLCGGIVAGSHAAYTLHVLAPCWHCVGLIVLWV